MAVVSVGNARIRRPPQLTPSSAARVVQGLWAAPLSTGRHGRHCPQPRVRTTVRRWSSSPSRSSGATRGVNGKSASSSATVPDAGAQVPPSVDASPSVMRRAATPIGICDAHPYDWRVETDEHGHRRAREARGGGADARARVDCVIRRRRPGLDRARSGRLARRSVLYAHRAPFAHPPHTPLREPVSGSRAIQRALSMPSLTAALSPRTRSGAAVQGRAAPSARGLRRRPL